MEAIEVADVPFLRRRKKVDVATPDRKEAVSMTHADIKLEDLRKRVEELQKVKAVVTIKTQRSS